MIARTSPIRQYINDALVYASATHTVDDVLAAIEAGRMQLWEGPHTAIVTEIHEYPQYRAINVFLAGGDTGYLAEFEKMAPLIEDWARAQGCTKATFAGRPGWMNTFLARSGWEKVKLVVLEKSL